MLSAKNTFLSRGFQKRLIHQCIEELDAYPFWETFCSSIANELSSVTGHNGVDDIIPIMDFHRELRKKKMPLKVKTAENQYLTLYIQNMVMVMKLKERDASDKVFETLQKLCSKGGDFMEVTEEEENQDSQIDDISDEIPAFPPEQEQKMIPKPVDRYGLLSFIRKEKRKFESYVDVMRHDLKDEVFLQSSKLKPVVIDDGSPNGVDNNNNETLKSIEENEIMENHRLKYNKLERFRLNLQSIAVATMHLGSQYNPRKFASVSYRSFLFPLTIGIFPHGNISSTGSTHEIASILSFQHILNILREMHGPLAFEDPYIRLNNLVLSGTTGYRICTTLLTRKYGGYCTKITGFSGISFINPDRTDKSHILIFRPGKLCYSGAKDIESVIQNMKILAPLLEECKASVHNVTVENNIHNSWPKSKMKITNENSRNSKQKSNKKKIKRITKEPKRKKEEDDDDDDETEEKLHRNKKQKIST